MLVIKNIRVTRFQHVSYLAAVLAGVAVVVGSHPLAQQELCLLQQTRRILKFTGLENVLMNYGEL